MIELMTVFGSGFGNLKKMYKSMNKASKNHKFILHTFNLRGLILNQQQKNYSQNNNIYVETLGLKHLDVTNNWIENTISETIYRYKKRIDPKDRKLLLLFRILGVKYRMLHTLKSHYKNSLIIEEELKILLDLFVLEAGLNYFTKGEMLV